LNRLSLLHYFNDLACLVLCDLLRAVVLPGTIQRAELCAFNGYHKMPPCPLKGVLQLVN